MRLLLAGVIGVLSTTILSTGQTLPASVAAVQKYMLEQDYPEAFGDKHYKTKIQNVVVSDLDGDGQAEVIVHFMPHYRQSPTIVIYRVTSDMKVKRVTEALAPGPLVRLTGNFLDSHTLGAAADMTAGAQQGDANVRRKFVDALLNSKASVVEYVNFFHMDGREGGGAYIDMTSLAVPPAKETCEDFEFSTVQQISAGIVPALGKGMLLAAWVPTKVYLYRIKSFAASGMLEKEVWAVDLPKDFNGFLPGVDGPMKYRTVSGAEQPFVPRCSGHNCSLSK